MLCCLVFGGCFFKNKQELRIDFSKDSTSIVISGINEVDCYQLQQQLIVDSLKHLPGIVEVRHKVTDSIISGEFSLTKDTLAFSPHKAFKKTEEYVLTTHLNSSFGTAKDILKGDLDKYVKGHEKVLLR